jgi:hypothetical protein
VLFEETTSTLLCGDLLSQLDGEDVALSTDDLVEPAMAAEAMFRSSSMAPDTATIMRRLGDLSPTTLAVMHGSSYSGDGGKALHDLADAYEQQYLQPTS